MKLKLIDKIFDTKGIADQVLLLEQGQKQGQSDIPQFIQNDDEFAFCIKSDKSGICRINLALNEEESEELAERLSFAVVSIAEGLYNETIYSLFDPQNSNFSERFARLCLEKILEKLELLHNTPAVRPREGLHA